MEHPLACRLEFGVTSRREERTSDPKISVMSRKNGWCGTMCVISPARYPDGSTSLLPQQRLGFQGVPRLKIVVCEREREKKYPNSTKPSTVIIFQQSRVLVVHQ